MVKYKRLLKNVVCGYYTGADSIDKVVRLVLSFEIIQIKNWKKRVETDIIITSGILERKKCMNNLFEILEGEEVCREIIDHVTPTRPPPPPP